MLTLTQWSMRAAPPPHGARVLNAARPVARGSTDAGTETVTLGPRGSTEKVPGDDDPDGVFQTLIDQCMSSLCFEGTDALFAGSNELYASEDYADYDPGIGSTGCRSSHRPLHPRVAFPESLLVARPVKRAEIESNPDAQAALRKEWDRLRNIRVWDEGKVAEWGDICRAGKKAHVGRIFEICVEKNSELPKGNPLRKYKGRVVFQGNQVWDTNYDYAIFQELSSNPATMEAAKAIDFMSLLDGFDAEQSDATQAYTQAELKGTPTYVRLPRHEWPESWSKMKDPVVPLRLALYGHPDAGGYWEKHCETALHELGFEPVKEWKSCFYHPKLRLSLIVYVDDFKMAGPKGNLKEGWKLIRSRIAMDDPTPLGRFLGCEHRTAEGKLGSTEAKPSPSGKVRIMEYDMSEFMKSCCEVYCEQFKVDPKSLCVSTPTPFSATDRRNAVHECQGTCSKCHAVCHSGNYGDIRREYLKNKAARVPSVLHRPAARVLMKVLYAARMARPDLLRAVCMLASSVNRWSEDETTALHRLMCYIHSSNDRRMFGWCGDSVKELKLDVFADADFAHDIHTCHSVSGGIARLGGPNTSFVVGTVSKQQAAVSHSTPEAEIVALDHVLRTVAIPADVLWSKLLGKEMRPMLKEDNEACRIVVQTGNNPQMRHVERTHRVDIRWIHEQYSRKLYGLERVDTTAQAADIFTKPFSEKAKWDHACKSIQVARQADFFVHYKLAGNATGALSSGGGLPQIPNLKDTGSTVCDVSNEVMLNSNIQQIDVSSQQFRRLAWRCSKMLGSTEAKENPRHVYFDMFGNSKAISSHIKGCKYMSLKDLFIGHPGHLVELMRWSVSRSAENQQRMIFFARVPEDMAPSVIVVFVCILVHVLRLLVSEDHATVCVEAEAEHPLWRVRGLDQVIERFPALRRSRALIGPGGKNENYHVSLLTDCGAVREKFSEKRQLPLSTRAFDKALAETLGRPPVSGVSTGACMMCFLEVQSSPSLCPAPRGVPPRQHMATKGGSSSSSSTPPPPPQFMGRNPGSTVGNAQTGRKGAPLLARDLWDWMDHDRVTPLPGYQAPRWSDVPPLRVGREMGWGGASRSGDRIRVGDQCACMTCFVMLPLGPPASAPCRNWRPPARLLGATHPLSAGSRLATWRTSTSRRRRWSIPGASLSLMPPGKTG